MPPRRVIILLAFLILFLGIILMVAFKRQPPVIPNDADHRRAGHEPQACLACHGPGGPNPRTPNHPMGNQPCGSCHFEVGEAR